MNTEASAGGVNAAHATAKDGRVAVPAPPAADRTQNYVPEHGHFVQRFDRNSNVHIANIVTFDNLSNTRNVLTACGNRWNSQVLRHASERDMDRRACRKCWELM